MIADYRTVPRGYIPTAKITNLINTHETLSGVTLKYDPDEK